MNKSVILLSGGLDSLVTLGYSKLYSDYNTELAITFDYGQKSFEKEYEASKAICEYYDIKFKLIKLDWLREITQTSLVAKEEIPVDNPHSKENMNKLWVPNRNALFLNIAACYCDSYGYNYILYGANADEGVNFPDNTENFRRQISETFEFSTQKKPKVVAPLIKHSKDDIVRIAIEGDMPLQLVWSCYQSGIKHCGKCASCVFLKNSLDVNSCDKLLKVLF